MKPLKVDHVTWIKVSKVGSGASGMSLVMKGRTDCPVSDRDHVTIYHDGHIRSDWFQLGMSRQKAEALRAAIVEIMGETPVAMETPHVGRPGRTDAVTVASPRDWKRSYPTGASTIKIRGCDAWRSVALTVARQIVIGNPEYFKLEEAATAKREQRARQESATKGAES